LEVVGELVSCVTGICARETASGPNDPEKKTGVVDLNFMRKREAKS
jgi:hypothetical protein